MLDIIVLFYEMYVDTLGTLNSFTYLRETRCTRLLIWWIASLILQALLKHY